MTNKFHVKTILFLSVFILFSCQLSAENIWNNDDIISVGQRDLKNFLDLIPVGSENIYGFHNRNEFKNVFIGAPYQIYSVDLTCLQNPDVKIGECIIPSKIWRLPVTINSHYRALLTIEENNGNPEGADFGAVGLAGELEKFNNEHPDLLSKTKAIFRIYQLQADFIIVMNTEKNDDGDFYPMESANFIKNKIDSKALKFKNGELLNTVKNLLLDLKY